MRDKDDAEVQANDALETKGGNRLEKAIEDIQTDIKIAKSFHATGISVDLPSKSKPFIRIGTNGIPSKWRKNSGKYYQCILLNGHIVYTVKDYETSNYTEFGICSPVDKWDITKACFGQHKVTIHFEDSKDYDVVDVLLAVYLMHRNALPKKIRNILKYMIPRLKKCLIIAIGEEE